MWDVSWLTPRLSLTRWCIYIDTCGELVTKIIVIFLQEDLYYPHPLIQDILWASLDKVVEPILMRWPGKKLREKALRTVMEHIHYEDENTRYICIGPVNKVRMHLLMMFFFSVVSSPCRYYLKTTVEFWHFVYITNQLTINICIVCTHVEHLSDGCAKKIFSECSAQKS